MACDHQALVEQERAEIWQAIEVGAELLLDAVCPACATPCLVHVMAEGENWLVVIATLGTFGARSGWILVGTEFVPLSVVNAMPHATPIAQP